MYQTRPYARMLVSHMPVRPAMALAILLHASWTGLEWVMRAETTCEQPQAILQVAHIPKAHLPNHLVLELLTQESAVERQGASVSGDLGRSAQLALGSTLEFRKMPGKIVLRTRATAAEKHHSRSPRVVCPPECMQPACETEKRLVGQPAEDWRLGEQVGYRFKFQRLHHLDIENELSTNSLVPCVLLYKLVQALDLVRVHRAKALAPRVDRLIAERIFLGNLCDRRLSASRRIETIWACAHRAHHHGALASRKPTSKAQTASKNSLLVTRAFAMQ